ncbi:Alkyltransferase-like protein 1 [Colletotrichum shisoi]|uniref:Alkyltransferase-like protein 1 n=1 Tax=Colletotrichum shisoi TaxID=2078593 RepID=A0A5Q4BP00_9PEZI|nr:Alkyltransferase-like protein 1 [Colletotrichum shisoi]
MPRTDEAEAFFHAVYTAVQEIPAGRVTTYGHIARLIGTRESAALLRRVRLAHVISAERPRQVGICLKHLPTDPASRFNNETVPWQRVINAKGTISPRSQPSGARSQAAALEGEDVEVSQTAMGEFQVDFKTYGWFPETLPSEQGQEQ